MALSLKGFLSVDGSGWELGFKKAESVAHKFSHNITHHLKSTIAGIFGVAAIEEGGRAVVEYGAKIYDTAQRLETSTDNVQKWEYALRQSGAEVGTAITFLEKLAQARDKALAGDPASTGLFHKFGISRETLQNNRIEEVGIQIGNAVKEGDSQKFIGALRELGGRGAGELVAAFKAGLEDKMQEAVHLGVIIDPKTVTDLKMASDEMSDFWGKIKSEAAPIVAGLAKLFRNLTEPLFAMVDTSKAFLVTLVKTKSIFAGLISSDKAWQASIDAMNAKDKRLREMQEKAKNGGKNSNGGPASVDEKAVEESIRRAKETLKLQEKLIELTRKNDRESMTTQEKINDLIKERDAIVKDNKGSGAIEAQIKATEISGEIDRLIQGQKSQAGINLTPLEQIGAKVSFVSQIDPLVAALRENATATKAAIKAIETAGKPASGFDGGSNDNFTGGVNF